MKEELKKLAYIIIGAYIAMLALQIAGGHETIFTLYDQFADTVYKYRGGISFVGCGAFVASFLGAE